MVEIIKTSAFDRWLRKLRDRRAKARIEMRIRRLSFGNPGHVEPVGEGLSETINPVLRKRPKVDVDLGPTSKDRVEAR